MRHIVIAVTGILVGFVICSICVSSVGGVVAVLCATFVAIVWLTYLYKKNFPPPKLIITGADWIVNSTYALHKLCYLKQNWDGRGANKIDHKAVDLAWLLFSALESQSFGVGPPELISGLPDGAVQLIWSDATTRLVAKVTNSGSSYTVSGKSDPKYRVRGDLNNGVGLNVYEATPQTINCNIDELRYVIVSLFSN